MDQSPPRTIYSAEDFHEGKVAYCTPAPRVLKRPLSKDAKRCQERGRPAWASRGLPHSRKDLTAAEKRIVCKVHQNLKAMLDSADGPFLKNEEWWSSHKGGPMREAVAQLCGISASTVSRITREAESASGILVSSQSHGPRKKSPSKIDMKDSHPSVRDIKGRPLYPLEMVRYARSFRGGSQRSTAAAL